MKLIKFAALSTLISLSAISTRIESASAQTGIDPWNGNSYDTSECAAYNSCYVDQYGDVFGSNNWEDPYHYQYDSYGNEYRQLQ